MPIVRPARPEDASETVRLAKQMFASMGADLSDPAWETEGVAHVQRRLGDDLVVFVVNDPAEPGRLVASAAGTVSTRLPNPRNPDGRAGYGQWVCTHVGHRSPG